MDEDRAMTTVPLADPSTGPFAPAESAAVQVAAAMGPDVRSAAIGTATPAEDHRRVIAIDGPAAAGKTTVAGVLADRVGAILFDTGTLYRAVTRAVINEGVAVDDEEAVTALARRHHIDISPPSRDDGRRFDVLLDGKDVTWAIRDPDVTRLVSPVSEHPGVRAALLPVQRRIAGSGPVVMVGRDIGTTVVPDAGVKIFLDASAPERARRRHAEQLLRGDPSPYDRVLADLIARDAHDANRSASPLRRAGDAIGVLTDHRTVADVVAEIEGIVRSAWSRFDAEDAASVAVR
ncbi:MAG: Cytidylate kinase [uncultured Thermomicrobiales bacterium]|uniref:Cytidylate kinase n=1 Tax=uncultured Thermomicrobiales bacterium TaxID=1645740 RepID=A0A6J4UNV5_9BACT|nr:MAG: Cytidylate kinase [uncultured Thermomicrobiales bacterium]